MLPDRDVPEDFIELAKEALVQIAIAFDSQWFFTTDTGYIGRASHPVQRDDVICILLGCRLPVVLRSQSDGSYTLVSFTYTQGVMDGEFIKEHLGEEEEFTVS